jgi:transcriptional regulator with GAF, ATPase, and Fis domain
MTATQKCVKAWLHYHLSQQDPFRETLVECLGKAGVETYVLTASEEPQGPGIVVLNEANATVCDFIRSASRNGTGRILAMACHEDGLQNDGAWRILHAGASDVMIWRDLPEPGAVISARLGRWQQVDESVASPSVKNVLVGQSPAWRAALRRIVEVAHFTEAPVLLVGETGTGKELAARLTHSLDQRRSQYELVILDCTTIVPDLSGSELFGHERGAFTGAVKARDGAFATANGGTLFLDEVGELPLELQVQLLRVLQEHTYKRVGSDSWRRTDFRLICATNRDLLSSVENGQFRRDLYYRIASWTIKLPPLRDRVDDIILLATHFMRQARPDEEPPALDARVREYFLKRDYPGNVRDLRNLVFRIMARHVGPGPITVGDIPSDERPTLATGPDGWFDPTVDQAIRRALGTGVELKELTHAIKDMAIRITVDNEGGNLQNAAHKLGVTARTLQLWRAEEQQRIQSMISSNGNGHRE